MTNLGLSFHCPVCYAVYATVEALQAHKDPHDFGSYFSISQATSQLFSLWHLDFFCFTGIWYDLLWWMLPSSIKLAKFESLVNFVSIYSIVVWNCWLNKARATIVWRSCVTEKTSYWPRNGWMWQCAFSWALPGWWGQGNNRIALHLVTLAFWIFMKTVEL